MDFRFSEEEERFRQEVREFIHQNLTPGVWRGRSETATDQEWAFRKMFIQKLAAKGWLSMQWPKEYGGQSAGLWHDVILAEEMAYHGAPTQNSMGLWVASILMSMGTEHQRHKYLFPILKGEVEVCFGLSEPQAGSDLAALQTRAIEDGDQYVINGQKVFTTLAHRADYCWVAARTNLDVPKHRGLSMFMVDMRTPGITVKPLMVIGNVHAFNEVFFDNVRVPKDCLVGGKDQGWRSVIASVGMERIVVGGGVTFAARARRYLEEIVDYAKKTAVDGQPLSHKAEIRQKLAQRAIEIDICRNQAYRLCWLSANGADVTREASVSKLYGSEMLQRLAETAVEVIGPPALCEPGSPYAILEGRPLEEYMFSLSYTIASGTSEVQRTIIATRGLGLPRG